MYLHIYAINCNFDCNAFFRQNFVVPDQLLGREIFKFKFYIPN